MLKRIGLAFIAFLSLAASPPQDVPRSHWLYGEWRGSGRMMGAQSVASLSVAPALRHKFVELRYTAKGFEGRAIYRPIAPDRWSGRWFDSGGSERALSAQLGAGEINVEWTAEGMMPGRTRYTRQTDGSLIIADEIRGATGSWRPFARHRLVRSR